MLSRSPGPGQRASDDYSSAASSEEDDTFPSAEEDPDTEAVRLAEVAMVRHHDSVSEGWQVRAANNHAIVADGTQATISLSRTHTRRWMAVVVCGGGCRVRACVLNA